MGAITLLAGWLVTPGVGWLAGRVVGMNQTKQAPTALPAARAAMRSRPPALYPEPLPARGEPIFVPTATRRVLHSELESSLEAHFNRVVRLHLGGRAVKLAPTEKGLPDRLVLLPGGRMHLVELKTLTGRTSAAQDLWHERAAALGTTVHVLVGREGIDAWIVARAQEVGTAPRVRK